MLPIKSGCCTLWWINIIVVKYLKLAIDYVLQKEETCEQQYLVLNVDEDNMRMSEFIKMHPHPSIKSFENGRGYYEFTEEEDLDTYKEVVCATSDQLKEVSNYWCYSLLYG